MSECQWFAGCHEEAGRDVEHPTVGWVPTCDRHIDWLMEDMTDGLVNPTKMVPPLAARHAAKIAAILERADG